MLGSKQLVNLVRVLAFDASPGSQISDDDILGHIDASIGFYQVKCAEENKDFFLRPTDITYVADQEMYRWARFVSRISMVEKTSLTPSAPAITTSFAEKFALNYGWGRNLVGQDAYFLRNTELGVAPVPNSAGDTLRVWASSAPPPMHYGIVSAAAATTLTFASTPTKGNRINLNDAYNEIPIIALDSTERVIEPNVITDYVASTRVCTLGFTWTTTPTAASSLYQLCPPLPEQFHPMVAYRAAAVAKIALEDSVNELLAMERDFFSTFTSYISRNQDQTPKGVTRLRWRM